MSGCAQIDCTNHIISPPFPASAWQPSCQCSMLFDCLGFAHVIGKKLPFQCSLNLCFSYCMWQQIYIKNIIGISYSVNQSVQIIGLSDGLFLMNYRNYLIREIGPFSMIPVTNILSQFVICFLTALMVSLSFRSFCYEVTFIDTFL